MIAGAALAAYAVVVGVLGARTLSRARWVVRFPHLGVLVWLALAASVVTASALAALAVAMPVLPLRFVLARAAGVHPDTVGAHYDSPLGALAVSIALGLAAVAALRVALVAARVLRRDARQRRDLRARLAMVGRPGPAGTTVLDSPEPAAWCLPGRGGSVVVTSAALELLSADQLRLVVGHERRHLAGHHHAVVTATAVLAEAFPAAPFAAAHRAVRGLVEMAADDVARRPDERRALARGLVTLSVGSRPGAALAASGTATLARVHRLRSAHPDRDRGPRLLTSLTAVLAWAVPVALLVAPAVEAACRGCLPLG